MKTPPTEYAKIFHSLLEKTPAAKRGEAIKSFAELLSESEDIKQGDDIIYAIEKYLYEKDGEVKTTETNKKDDPALIGGVKIRIGDILVDNSIKSRISRLKTRINPGSPGQARG